MNDERVRKKFEAFISAPPFEREISRYGENGQWPKAYVDYHVHLAWDAWQAAWREGMSEAAGICEDRICATDLPTESDYSARQCAAAIRERVK